MDRREFITLLGGAAAACPLAARAQQAWMPVIGYFTLNSSEGSAASLVALRNGLAEAGYIEGRNVAIEYRFAGNQFDRIPELAVDLVRRRVTVIVAAGNAAAFAAKAATTAIPIVFLTGGDPVQNGLVTSLNRPGGNITGVTDIGAELSAKRLGLLHELMPVAANFAVLVNPTSPNTDAVIKAVRAAAYVISRDVEIIKASTNREIDDAFSSLTKKHVNALVVTTNTLFIARRVQLVGLAAHHRLPAIYGDRSYTEIGGLASYGTNGLEQSRQAGIYVGRILKQEKPSDLPVLQPTKFELVINLQTARTLGIVVPASLHAIADEVIE